MIIILIYQLIHIVMVSVELCQSLNGYLERKNPHISKSLQKVAYQLDMPLNLPSLNKR